MEQQFFSHTVGEMWQVAKGIAGDLKGQNIVLLKGELGSGKTTFAQGVLASFEAAGPYTSPTFVIMKEYKLENQKFDAVYHLDCYRVSSNDILELGWEEIVNNKKNLILVEWPERIWEIIPQDHIIINFEIIDQNQRKMNLTNNKQ